jgi:hypothetical protein
LIITLNKEKKLCEDCKTKRAEEDLKADPYTGNNSTRPVAVVGMNTN